MALFLPYTTVLIWDNARNNRCPECFLCTPLGRSGSMFDCDQWMQKQNRWR